MLLMDGLELEALIKVNLIAENKLKANRIKKSEHLRTVWYS